jgi:hypothetical protein
VKASWHTLNFSIYIHRIRESDLVSIRIFSLSPADSENVETRDSALPIFLRTFLCCRAFASTTVLVGPPPILLVRLPGNASLANRTTARSPYLSDYLCYPSIDLPDAARSSQPRLDAPSGLLSKWELVLEFWLSVLVASVLGSGGLSMVPSLRSKPNDLAYRSLGVHPPTRLESCLSRSKQRIRTLD